MYLFLDAIYLKLRPDDKPAEGVLVAWGVTLEGRKVLLGLDLGRRESYEGWLDFGRDLLARGVRPPALIVADGAPGLWKAVARAVAGRPEQRCTVHALRNVTTKLPERQHRELKARYWRFSTRRARPRRRTAAFSDRRRLPQGLPVGDGGDRARPRRARRAPPLASEHRKRIRTTNLLERTFVEVRRRTKVIGRFPARPRRSL